MHPASPKLPTEPYTVPRELRTIADHHTSAVAIANAAVRTDIEVEAIRVKAEDGTVWWDTRPMTDQQRWPDEVIEQATEHIRYAITYGLCRVHPQQPYLLSFTEKA